MRRQTWDFTNPLDRGTPGRERPTEYRLDQELSQKDIQGFRERATNAAAGGLRFLASALEPLQLPQDVFFATLEATMDNEKTMLENLKEVEWAKYAPGGATPARVTDGQQILELAGVQDERTKQWGGLLMDLVVDPLIFGSMATVIGKASKVEGLVNLGRNMDRFVAPSTWGRTAYNRIPQVKAAVDDVTGQVLNALRNPDATLFGLQGGVVHGAANWTADMLVSRRTAQQLRLGQFGDELPATLERSQQLGTQRAQDVVASLQDEFPEMFAMMGEDLAPQKMRRIMRKLGQYRREEESILDIPQIVRDTMEKEGYDFLRQNPATLTPGIGWTDDVKRLYNEGLPEGFQLDPEHALGNVGYTARQSRNIARREEIYKRTKLNQLERAGKSPEEAKRIAQRARDRIPRPENPTITQRTLDTFDESVEAVRDVARRSGYADSAEKYAQQYRDFVTRLAAKKAEIGYELSGMSMVKEVVAKRGTEIFGSTEEALKVWSRILHAGVSDEGLDAFLKQSSGIGPKDVNKLTKRGMRQAIDRRRTYDRTLANQKAKTRGNLPEEEAREVAERRASAIPGNEPDLPAQTAAYELNLERSLGETAPAARVGKKQDQIPTGDFTWRELLGDEWEGFSSLDVGAYLAGLRTGHLYRTFGIWQTTEDMSQWARKIESGVIVPNNIIDTPTVRRQLTEQGFGEEGKLLEDYINATTRRAAGRGALVDTRKFGRYVAEQLEQTGVAKAEAGRRARDAIEELTNSTSAGRRAAGQKIRQDIIPSFERQIAQRQRGGPLSKGRFGPREDFSDDVLAVMGEMTQPFVSLAEDAQALQSRLPAMRFMKEVYDQGLKSGAVRKQPFTDTNGVVFQRVKSDADLAKPFTNKYVHPQLVKEIRKAQARQDYTPNRLQHLRSLITGGYLAAPNIMAANLFGGLLSSWEGGIPPHKMLSAMARTFRPLLDDGGRHYKPLQELRQREAISLHGMSTNDIRKNFKGFQMEDIGVGPEGLRKAGKMITDRYEWLLRGGPSATRWAGLDGFQFTEKWMKTSAYLAAKEMAEEAGAMGRAVRGTADEAGQVLRREGDIQNWAAEMARTSVFDYCVDDQTEALTDRGWLPVDEIDPMRDRVLTRNIETNETEWERPKEIYVGEAKPRTMKHIYSSRFDALVTENHRWITQSGHGPYRIRETRELNSYATLVASGGEYKAPTLAQHKNELVELVGWYVTEGTNQTRGQGVQIAQSLQTNPEYVMQLRALAEFYRARGATVSEYQRDIGWGTICSFYFGKGIGSILRRVAPEKRLTMEFLRSLTKEQLELLFKTVVAADGHVKEGTIIYTQQDGGRLDDFEILAALLGYRTKRRPVHSSDCESVTAYRTKHVHYADLSKEDVEYDGRVWCPVTQNGTWFARRNGSTYWTGNSELPEGLAFLRDYGILLFPGFPYFMTTRTIRAVGERPGVVAGTDRVAEAIGSAFADNEEEQMAMWANMPDWLKDDQGVPVGRWKDEADNTRMSFIPMNQLLPTNTFGGNPFAESLATGGLYRPFMEAMYAHLEGSGEAVFSQRFGQRVFNPEQNTGERAMATLSFMYNNLAPALPRKMFSPRVGEDAAGILPKLVMPRETVDGLYTFDERQNTRAERGLRDELISATLRSSRVTAQEGPLIGIRNELDSARREHGAKIASLRERIRRAQASGDRKTAQRLMQEARRMDAEFRAQWSEWLQIAQQPDWQGP